MAEGNSLTNPILIQLTYKCSVMHTIEQQKRMQRGAPKHKIKIPTSANRWQKWGTKSSLLLAVDEVIAAILLPAGFATLIAERLFLAKADDLDLVCSDAGLDESVAG